MPISEYHNSSYFSFNNFRIKEACQGSPFLKIFTCPTSKICFFQYQIIYDLEEKIVQIYLPDGQFYLPRAVGQWDMSSPACFHVICIIIGEDGDKLFINKPVKASHIGKLWGQHGAHLGPVGPRWAPCWPHEPCYQGCLPLPNDG